MDHLTRVQRAIDFIEQHLREEIHLEAVARAGGLSFWHFQRVFRAAVGVTLKEYVRDRRLTSALIDLGSTDRRILEIALDYQFESQESFSRAFKSLFHRTPGDCRRRGITSIPPASKLRITYDYLDHLYGGITMQPKTITMREKKVVGVAGRFISILSPDKNNDVVIPRLWDEFIQREGRIVHRSGAVNIGLCQAIPDDQPKHPEECLYVACTEVTAFDSVPEGMSAHVIPAGRYAVFTHKGKLDQSLEHTYNYIYGSWLPRSGEELRDAPDLELYDERFKFGSDDSEVDIYIPIK